MHHLAMNDQICLICAFHDLILSSTSRVWKKNISGSVKAKNLKFDYEVWDTMSTQG